MTRTSLGRAWVAAGRAAAVCAALSAGCASHGPGPADPPARDPGVARAENDRAFQLLSAGQDAEAEQALRRALAADDTYWHAWNNLGLVRYRAGDLYPAAKAFDTAARLMPHRPEPWNNLGLVYERAGQWSKAVDAYAAARGMDPDSPEYLGNLARARVRRGDRDADTRRLLEEVASRDARPAWADWARRSLLRLTAGGGPEEGAGPATTPARVGGG